MDREDSGELVILGRDLRMGLGTDPTLRAFESSFPPWPRRVSDQTGGSRLPTADGPPRSSLAMRREWRGNPGRDGEDFKQGLSPPPKYTVYGCHEVRELLTHACRMAIPMRFTPAATAEKDWRFGLPTVGSVIR